MVWYFGTEDREHARKEWDDLDLSQQRGIIATHLGQRGHIKVHKAKILNRGLDTSTIKIRWSLSNEANGPEDPDVVPPAPRRPASK